MLIYNANTTYKNISKHTFRNIRQKSVKRATSSKQLTPENFEFLKTQGYKVLK
jgi:hypothetical protein